MDPFVPVSLASSILTFVDFGAKTVKVVVEIARSPDRISERNRDIKEHVEALNDFCANLNDGIEKLSLVQRCKEESNILKLSKDAIQLAQELKRDLEALRPLAGEDIVKVATKILNALCEARTIERKNTKLASLSKRIHKELLAALYQTNSAMMREILEKQSMHQKLQIESQLKLDEVKKGLIKVLTDMQIEQMDHLTENIEKIKSQEKLLRQEEERLTLEHQMLNFLHFPEMRIRRDRILFKHDQTFGWIFDAQHEGEDLYFSSWLESGSGIFWISGNAGSGKSTLMKWLQSAPQTKRLLRSWAGNQKLCTESFFFWYLGSDMQKSYTGLLRTILHEVLRRFPSMIGRLSEELCSEVLQHWDEPSVSSEMSKKSVYSGNEDGFLKQLGESVLRVSPDMRLCFFIDGLDEYDGHKEELIKLLKRMSALPNIKMCVSSRPWREFEEAFSDSARQSFVLHEHNMADIRAYAKGNLESHSAISRSTVSKHELAEIIEMVVDRAKGVFLWVFLIVKSLESGISNRDLIKELRRRVEVFPDDLTEFFQRMLKEIDKEYHETSAQILLMLLHGRSSVPVLTFQNISEADLSDEMGPELDITSWNEPALRDHSRNVIQPRLKARCKDFVDVFDSGGRHCWVSRLQVDLLHRTVFDFLTQSENRKLLEERAGYNFRPEYELSKNTTFVLSLFSSAHAKKHKFQNDAAKSKGFSYEDGNDYLGLLRRVIDSCHNMTMKSGVIPKEIMHEAESVLDHLPVELRQRVVESSSLSSDVSFSTQDIVLALAIEVGFLRYVEHKFDANKFRAVKVRGKLTLGMALNLAPTGCKAEIIRIMLQNGAQVREDNEGLPFWDYFLMTTRNRTAGLRSAHLKKVTIQREEFTQIVILLVQHGANVHDRVEISRQKVRKPISETRFPKLHARSASSRELFILQEVKEEAVAWSVIKDLCDEDDYQLILAHFRQEEYNRSRLTKIMRGIGDVLRAIGTP